MFLGIEHTGGCCCMTAFIVAPAIILVILYFRKTGTIPILSNVLLYLRRKRAS